VARKANIPRQVRSKKTEQALLHALDNLLSRKSYVELTVSEIAAEAGVTTGAIYRRFENKDALLIATIARGMMRTQRMGESDQEQFSPDLPDGQLVMNLMRELFRLSFENLHFMRAANYVIDPDAMKGLVEGRNVAADWFSTLLTSTRDVGRNLQHKCRFIFRMAMAVYFATLLSGIPPEADREAYLKNHQNSIDRLLSQLYEMCCKYLDIKP
jgi:AcrR family transcriptional regulator